MIFLISSGSMGDKLGYINECLLCRFFWCLNIPIGILGYRVFNYVYMAWESIKKTNVAGFFALYLPLVLGFGHAFRRAIPRASFIVTMPPVLLAFIHRTLEEVFWRSTFTNVFTDSWRLGLLAGLSMCSDNNNAGRSDFQIEAVAVLHSKKKRNYLHPIFWEWQNIGTFIKILHRPYDGNEDNDQRP